MIESPPQSVTGDRNQPDDNSGPGRREPGASGRDPARSEVRGPPIGRVPVQCRDRSPMGTLLTVGGGSQRMAELAAALRGITTPLVTPFTNGAIDWAGFDAVVDHVLEGGVEAVFPCGTTGEVASLTGDERRALLERTVERTPNSVPVLVGGTGTAIGPSRRWIAEAAELGADGVVATAPYFHPANDPDGYRDFFEQLAADSPRPIVLYNIPACVGEVLPLRVVDSLAAHPRIIGLKDSGGDLTYAMAVRDRTPESFLILQGYDPLLLPSMLLGFDGGVNAVSNVIPEAYVAITGTPERARDLHVGAVRPLFELCDQHGFAAGVKAALASEGIISGGDVRPPLVPVSPDRAAAPLQRARATLG